MRDRLGAVECPSDIIDQIGGWLTQVLVMLMGMVSVCILFQSSWKHFDNMPTVSNCI